MARTPTLTGRFGGPTEVCPPSVRHTWNLADRDARKTLAHGTEQVLKARIAVIVSAVVALIALALATRVAAQPVDTFAKRTVMATSFCGGWLAEGLTTTKPIVVTGGTKE